MQTSKSYGSAGNNVEVKLELDDLEYVFADGHNLIINPGDASGEADESNIVYTDGSQTVVLQSGVKHYIQTLEGETYLLGNDSDSIQQLVINTEDQSQESNSAVDYIHNEEGGETIIYKLAEAENEISEGEPQPKRFKIGNTEYVTLDDDQSLQETEDNQLDILDESSVSENSSFQYAILKDGKLHLQLCEPNSIEVLNDNAIDQTHDEESVQEYDNEDGKIQEYVLINTNTSSQNAVDLLKLGSDKNVRGRKGITLDEYLNQAHNVDQTKNVEEGEIRNGKSRKRNQNQDDYLNKKVLIRKTANGKSLFGKILHIQPGKKATNEEEDLPEASLTNDKAVTICSADEESSESNQNQIEDDENVEGEDDAQGLASGDEGHVVNDTTLMEFNRELTEEHINFVSKTLHGLVDMPSLKKKLVNHRLEIKFVEKEISDGNQEMIKYIRYISGRLTQHDSGFELDQSDEQKNVTSLTIVVSQDINDHKVTKVTFHEKSVLCDFCNKSFHSPSMLNKHIQSCHSDRAFSCNTCQIKFTNHALLNDHRKSSGHDFKCEVCSERFATQGTLTRHQYVHTQNRKNLTCVICKAHFTNVSSLSKHILTHTHEKDQPGFTYRDLHRRVHGSNKTFFCGVCGREFSRHSNLLRHVEIHKGDGDLYRCGICECSYKFISSLTRHIVQNHMKQPA